jgi:hypothetical protein
LCAICEQARKLRSTGSYLKYAKIGREINPSVYPADEFRRKAAAGHHFLKTVLASPKVFLIGDENELEGLLDNGWRC